MSRPLTDIDLPSVIASITRREQLNLSLFGAEHRRLRTFPGRFTAAAAVIVRTGKLAPIASYLWYVAAHPVPIPNLFFYSRRILIAEFPSRYISRALQQAGSEFNPDHAAPFDKAAGIRAFFQLRSLAPVARSASAEFPVEIRPFCIWLLARFCYWFAYYRQALADTEISAVVVHDDLEPRILGLACAAQSHGIAVGLFRMSDEHTRPIPPFRVDTLFCWNQGQKDAMSGRYRCAAHLPRVRVPMHPLSSDHPISVAILVNAFYDLTAVQALCTRLAQYVHIGRIYIRPHPRSDANQFSNPSGTWSVASGEPLSALAERIDVAVCGNSSVTMELLYLGIPVVYADDLEQVPRDVYGYHASGIVPAMQEVDIDVSAINQFYRCPDWIRTIDERSEPSGDSLGVREAMRRLGNSTNNQLAETDGS